VDLDHPYSPVVLWQFCKLLALVRTQIPQRQHILQYNISLFVEHSRLTHRQLHRQTLWRKALFHLCVRDLNSCSLGDLLHTSQHGRGAGKALYASSVVGHWVRHEHRISYVLHLHIPVLPAGLESQRNEVVQHHLSVLDHLQSSGR
jgi:hypothetical protein